MTPEITMHRCSRCIMSDQSDPLISFNKKGECNYCSDALLRKNHTYFPNEEGKLKLHDLIHEIKKEGKGKPYDCVMGFSGGLDSSYLAMIGHQMGLRILALHIDDGFDTPVATENIQKLCEKTNVNLITVKPDSCQFKALTKAYILAGVPNLAIPQDNILFAELYAYMRKFGIKYFLTGGNFALENILQRGNSHSAFDVRNIKAIHKRFGDGPINKLKFLSENKRILNRYFYGIRTLRPLNYIDYDKAKAIQELKSFCDFNYYEAKHLENTLTKVHQLYWLYHKFGVDKRTSHLSSLIISDQMSREEALLEISKPLYEPESMEKDLANVLAQLDISRAQFDRIISEPGHQHTDFPYSHNYILSFLRRIPLVKKIIRL